MLKELAFAFVSYIKEEVQDKRLSQLLLAEYMTILVSLIDAKRLANTVSEHDMFWRFFQARRKKMNMQMMILCDCVAQEQSDANKTDLYRFIADLSEIIEIKAVAMKDLHDSVTKP